MNKIILANDVDVVGVFCNDFGNVIHGNNKSLQVGRKVRLPLFHEQHQFFPDEYFITVISCVDHQDLAISISDTLADGKRIIGPWAISDLMPV